MFAIEPFNAQRQVWNPDGNGGMVGTWQPCRVVGVSESKGKGGDEVVLEYVIEVRDSDGWYSLEREGYLRRGCPTA